MSLSELKAFYSQVLSTKNDAILERAVSVTEVREYQKGDLLLETGQVPQYLLFLLNGVARSFQRGANGREVTLCIPHRQGDVLVTDSDLRAPASSSFEALTPLQIAAVPIEDMFGMLAEYPQLYVPFAAYYAKSVTLHMELQTAMHKPALERFRWFLKRYPGLVGCIPDKYIASFLGMSSVTLSRLRHVLIESDSSAPL